MRKGLRLVLLAGGLAFGGYAIVNYFILGRGVPKGNWHGTFVTPSGTPGALQLVVRVPKAPRVNNGGGSSGAGRRVEGTAQDCIGHPESQHFDLSGRMSGDAFMTMAPVGEPVVGLRFTDLDVDWHGDELTVSGLLTQFDGVHNVSDGANPDHMQPTTVTLTKGTDADYEAACAGLAGG